MKPRPLKPFKSDDLARIANALCMFIGSEQYEIWKSEEEGDATKPAKNELRKLTNLLTKINNAIPEDSIPENWAKEIKEKKGYHQSRHGKIVVVVKEEDEEDLF